MGCKIIFDLAKQSLEGLVHDRYLRGFQEGAILTFKKKLVLVATI